MTDKLLTHSERDRLRATIRAAIPQDVPLSEVVSALGTLTVEICLEHGVSPERTLEAHLRVLREHRRKFGS